jgi:hypothetical protein
MKGCQSKNQEKLNIRNNYSKEWRPFKHLKLKEWAIKEIDYWIYSARDARDLPGPW